MPRFFVDQVEGDFVLLEGETARHISRSLRMKVGDILTLSDGKNTDYGCSIAEIDNETVRLQVLYSGPSDLEPSLYVTLYQGVPKGDKLDDIIQKCVELGVSRIVPTMTGRCVSRPDAKSAKKKQERWQKIALEAAKQCGRGIIPEVTPIQPFSQAVSDCEATLKLLFYEGGGASLRTLEPKLAGESTAAIFIGPEGGFEKEEVRLAKEAGALPMTLGKRILRTQTAPVAALAALMLQSGNLDG